MTIEITNESGVEVDETVLLRLTEHNLAELHVSADADIAILLVDEGAMEALHVQWMDEPGPTDVLSFPMDELRPGTQEEPTPAGLLGERYVGLTPGGDPEPLADGSEIYLTQSAVVLEQLIGKYLFGAGGGEGASSMPAPGHTAPAANDLPEPPPPAE